MGAAAGRVRGQSGMMASPVPVTGRYASDKMLSATFCASCAVIPASAGTLLSAPFPPEQRAAFHDAV
jgi:hypothetical protein